MAYEALFAETVLIRGHLRDQIDAYLARPLRVGPQPGVVVIHHMPGWDGPTKEIARRFATTATSRFLPTSISVRRRPHRRRTAPVSARPEACRTTARWAMSRARSITFGPCRI